MSRCPPFERAQPDQIQRVLQAAAMIEAEIKKRAPDKSFLKSCAESLKLAVTLVVGISAHVLNIVAKIVMLVIAMPAE